MSLKRKTPPPSASGGKVEEDRGTESVSRPATTKKARTGKRPTSNQGPTATTRVRTLVVKLAAGHNVLATAFQEGRMHVKGRGITKDDISIKLSDNNTTLTVTVGRPGQLAPMSGSQVFYGPGDEVTTVQRDGSVICTGGGDVSMTMSGEGTSSVIIDGVQVFPPPAKPTGGAASASAVQTSFVLPEGVTWGVETVRMCQAGTLDIEAGVLASTLFVSNTGRGRVMAELGRHQKGVSVALLSKSLGNTTMTLLDGASFCKVVSSVYGSGNVKIVCCSEATTAIDHITGHITGSGGVKVFGNGTIAVKSLALDVQGSGKHVWSAPIIDIWSEVELAVTGSGKVKLGSRVQVPKACKGSVTCSGSGSIRFDTFAAPDGHKIKASCVGSGSIPRCLR